MNNAFWIGVFPGIGDKEIEYIKEKVKSFLLLQPTNIQRQKA